MRRQWVAVAEHGNLTDTGGSNAIERAHEHAAPQYVEQSEWKFTEVLHRRPASHQHKGANSAQAGSGWRAFGEAAGLGTRA
jgi:hypothetical protein